MTCVSWVADKRAILPTAFVIYEYTAIWTGRAGLTIHSICIEDHVVLLVSKTATVLEIPANEGTIEMNGDPKGTGVLCLVELGALSLIAPAFPFNHVFC